MTDHPDLTPQHFTEKAVVTCPWCNRWFVVTFEHRDGLTEVRTSSGLCNSEHDCGPTP
jgi:hypothetical protein